MTTSGVVGQSVLDVVSVIEKAVRKCGVLPSSLGSEQLVNARDSLALILIELSNRGVNLWCQQKRVITPPATTVRFSIGSDIVDVLNASYRQGTYTAATSYGSGPGVDPLASATVDYGSSQTVALASASLVAPVSGTYNLLLERSSDGVSWTTSETTWIPNVVAGQRICIDPADAAPSRFWRMSETLLTATFSSATFVSSVSELPMAQMSRDTYAGLPNKVMAYGAIPQYFFDKQAPAPSLWLWPTVPVLGPQIVMWVQRQIQDVGDLTNTLDLPTRWLNAIIFRLGAQLCLELPKELIDSGRYKLLTDLAEIATRSAEDGETDGAPLVLRPNISVYTR